MKRRQNDGRMAKNAVEKGEQMHIQQQSKIAATIIKKNMILKYVVIQELQRQWQQIAEAV